MPGSAASRSRRLSRRTTTSTTSMPPLGLASACSSSASESTRQCGVRVAAQRLARSTPCGVPKSGSKRSAYCRVALLEHREDRAAVVVDDHDRQVGPRLVGAEDQAVGVVQERHVAHQREAAGAVRRGRGRRRSRSRPCRRCRTGRGWRSPCGGRRRRTRAPSGRGRGSGWRRRRPAARRAAAPRLTAPATSCGVRPALGGEQRVEPAAPPARSRRRATAPARPGRRRARWRPRRAARATPVDHGERARVGPDPRPSAPRAPRRRRGRAAGSPAGTASGARRRPPARSARPSSVAEQQPVGSGSRCSPVREPLVGSASSGQPAALGQHPRRRAGVVAGDHHGARAGGDRLRRAAAAPRASSTDRRAARRRAHGAQPSPASGTSGSSSWTLRWTGPRRGGRGDRGTARGQRAPAATCRRSVPDRRRAVRRGVRTARRRCRPGRWSGWRPCRAAAPGRSAVTHDERHAGVRGLEHRRVQVGDRRAATCVTTADRRRPWGQPEGEEAGGPLVDAGVQPDQAGLGGVVRREGQRGVARARARARPRVTPPATSAVDARHGPARSRRSRAAILPHGRQYLGQPGLPVRARGPAAAASARQGVRVDRRVRRPAAPVDRQQRRRPRRRR